MFYAALMFALLAERMEYLVVIVAVAGLLTWFGDIFYRKALG
jgi:hypothetical protein